MGDLTGVYESGRFKGIPCNEDVPESILEQLVQNAHDAKLNAYAIYSNFRVGAAVLSSSGVIYQGCNVENSSYGLTVCAERCAVFKVWIQISIHCLYHFRSFLIISQLFLFSAFIGSK